MRLEGKTPIRVLRSRTYIKGRAPSTIKNLEALYITSSDATLKAEYKVENQWSDAKIRFEYKENSSDTWNYTDWRVYRKTGSSTRTSTI